MQSESQNDKALKTVIESRLNGITDPGSGAKLVDLGLIRNLSVTEGNVSLTFRPSSSVCPVAFRLAPGIKAMIGTIKGIKSVDMEVTNFNRAEELMELLRDD